MDRMLSFKRQSSFRLASINLFVKHLKSKDLRELQEEFNKMDTNQSGYVSVEEL